MSEAAPLSLCCCERREPGIFFFAMLHHLVDLQNDFLEQCTNFLSLPAADHISTHFRSAPGLGWFPKRAVQFVRSSDYIQIDRGMIDNLVFKAGLVTWDVRYGHGRELVMELHEIEKVVAKQVLERKALIDKDSLDEVSYQMEAFQACATTLYDVAHRFEQQPIPRESLEALANDLERCHDLYDVKAALETLLCFLRQDGGSPDGTIEGFVKTWFSTGDLDGGFVKSTLCDRHLGSLPLTQVNALYEYVEDMVADACDWSVHPAYHDDLPDDLREALLNVIDFIQSGQRSYRRRIRGSDFVKVIKRFAFRFFSSGRDPPWSPMHPLAFYLSDPRCIMWPPGSILVNDDETLSDAIQECIPEGLLLRHTGAVYEMLKESTRY